MSTINIKAEATDGRIRSSKEKVENNSTTITCILTIYNWMALKLTSFQKRVLNHKFVFPHYGPKNIKKWKNLKKKNKLHGMFVIKPDSYG